MKVLVQIHILKGFESFELNENQNVSKFYKTYKKQKISEGHYKNHITHSSYNTN